MRVAPGLLSGHRQEGLESGQNFALRLSQSCRDPSTERGRAAVAEVVVVVVEEFVVF
jgi:hypothetical protein